jgi:hypothetical protein
MAFRLLTYAAMPWDGDKNEVFADYANACCGSEIVIRAGSSFPACPKHPKQTAEWTQIDVDIADSLSNGNLSPNPRHRQSTKW